jgi:hypothetical protein
MMTRHAMVRAASGRSTAAIAALLIVCTIVPAGADPVAVRFPEGTTHGFLVLRSTAGNDLAAGELIQIPQGGERIESRLIFRFKDGSLYDETMVFSQAKVFSLLTYRLLQRGKSFPTASDVSFDRRSGKYKAKVGDKTADGQIDMPADVYNGMFGMLAKNLTRGGTASGHVVSLEPKPRIVKAEVAAEGEDQLFHGDEAMKATRYLMKLELGGVTGIVASVVGKKLPNVRYWIATGPAPAFVKFEGQMFVDAPTWRIELTGPRWSK